MARACQAWASRTRQSLRSNPAGGPRPRWDGLVVRTAPLWIKGVVNGYPLHVKGDRLAGKEKRRWVVGMNRRGFLGALATGLVGACVATKVPTGWLPEPVRRTAAREYMRKAYNEYARGVVMNHPRAMLVGRELYEAYEGELVAMERFVWVDREAESAGLPTLAFKGAHVLAHPLTGLRGWEVLLLSQGEWQRAKADLGAGRPWQWARAA
jgi:hypothetical protein